MSSKYKQGKKQKSQKPEANTKPKFEFPSNVRQIGGLNKGLKVYIEDYAYTYISKLGTKTGSRDTAAFLVGFLTEELGENILVIVGAISPPFTSPAKDGQAFSDSDWSYARKTVEKFFQGMEIVGWARLQPGYGLYLSSADISGHYIGFTDKHAVLFLSDPEEKVDCFFAWNENQDDLIEISGYFIYYDKNDQMNAYITETRRNDGEDIILDVSEEEYSSESSEEYEEVSYETEKISEEEDEPPIYEAGISRTVEKARRIADVQRQKRIIGMMTSVSVLLFFACVIMIIGLLQSGERISDVESQLKELRSGYNNVVSKLNDTVFPAFAAQNSNVAQNEVPEEAEQTGFVTEIVSDGAALADANAELDKALGISAVDEANQEAALQANEQKAPEPPQTVYVVQQGDTLTKISQLFYGTASNIAAIMEANGLSDPDRLIVGTKLVIP